MNDVEQQLRDAAEETRQFARNHWPKEFGETETRSKSGFLVFAAAFAVVVLVVGFVPLLLGDGPATLPEQTPQFDAPVDTATPDTTPTTDVAETVVCSATGVQAPADDPSLPDAVSSTRAAIIAAAIACDLAALETHAADGFNTSFGGGGFENLVRWELEDNGRLGTLLQILDLSHGTIDTGDGEIYVWPAAHHYDSWEDIPDSLVDELRQVHTDDELGQMAEFGAYMGWRTGIDQDGNWLYFVAGD